MGDLPIVILEVAFVDGTRSLLGSGRFPPVGRLVTQAKRPKRKRGQYILPLKIHPARKRTTVGF
jgi:hypothetical protein